jgi:hypothetical protein
MAENIYRNMSGGLSSPAANIEAVTPNDAADLSYVARGLACAVTGTISVITLGGQTTQIFVVAGVVYPGLFERVRADGTSAENIVAHW